MIISKTPLRMSFIGGGTDHLINERSYGSVITTSINKFIYLSLINNHEKKILINYSLREKVDEINQIKHSIVRETLKYFKIKIRLKYMLLQILLRVVVDLVHQEHFRSV